MSNYLIIGQKLKKILFYPTPRFRILRRIFSSDGGGKDLDKRDRLNKYPFVPVPCLPADGDSVFRALEQHLKQPGFLALDGLLCYHRRVHYLPGRKTNPLVLWLKPYMAPELMGAEVPAEIKAQAPGDYLSAKDFIAHYREAHERKKRRWKRELQRQEERREQRRRGKKEGEEMEAEDESNTENGVKKESASDEAEEEQMQ